MQNALLSISRHDAGAAAPRTATAGLRRVRQRLAAAVAITLAGVSTAAFPAPGDLVASFGNGGVVFLEGPTDDPTFRGHDHVAALVALPDGRALVAGSFDMGRDLGYSNMAVVRLLANGQEDTAAFGDDALGGSDGPGRTEVQLPGDQDGANAMLVLPDGRIVVAGALEPSANSDFGIARFSADGVLDPGFGEPDGMGGRLGYARINAGTSTAHNDYAVAIARQALGGNAGKLVLAGSGIAPEGDICCYRRFGLARFNADGTPDASFGTGGVLLVGHSGNPSSAEYPTAIATRADGSLPDDRITVVGLTNSVQNPSSAIVRRFLADGTPDTSFDGDGLLVIQNTHVSGVYSGLKSVDAAVYQPDGKLLLVGRAGDHGFTFLRLNFDGTRDTGFGTSGRVSVTFPNSVLDDEPAAVALQPNGKIVAAGFFASEAGADFAVVRLLPGGALDSGFGNGGRVSHALVPATDSAAAVAIMPDGSILAGGLAQRPGVPNLQTDMALLRLQGDPDIFSDGFED